MLHCHCCGVEQRGRTPQPNFARRLPSPAFPFAKVSTMIQDLRNAIEWRWKRLRQLRFLRKHFKNGDELVAAYLGKTPLGVAACSDGWLVTHPKSRRGLAETILEIWHTKIYTGRFYQPQPGDAIIDAGANVGLFSTWIGHNHPDTTVYAFEPCRENYEHLLENIRSCGSQRVQAHWAAVGGCDGTTRVTSEDVRSLDHRLDPNGMGESVPLYSFKSVVEMVARPRIALCKVDIEGSEFELFESADTNSLDRIDRFAIEYHEHLKPGVVHLIRAKLEATHRLRIEPDPGQQYGMIYALHRGHVQ